MATISKKRKKWQVQIRKVNHKAICRTFPTRAEAKAFAADVESKLDRGEFLAHNDMPVAGLVKALRDETENGRLLATAYRTSLGHIDRLLGLRLVSEP